ncbi:predicted membrane protein [Pelotomaculum thermopropionicum SI]|uniref:Predicted membrane protein n=1 Tax=Pelotomaculum thermopropionicum (strain DSM 13744 / JCM 10971 / SI) TaxID=370438 RepID=A5D091_PELTS|nr:predicted membrane protein [Pelotomaculum thermopropionicum SI]
MEEQIYTLAFKEGLWAVLFVTLFVYQLRESRRLQDVAKEREDRLTALINDITKQLETLATKYERMSYDLQEIRVCLLKEESRK